MVPRLGAADPDRLDAPRLRRVDRRLRQPPGRRAVRKTLLQEVADIGPRYDFDIGGLGDLRDGTQLAQSSNNGRRAVRSEDDYTKLVRPEYELGCDIAERRSREFWQGRFGVTPD